MLRQILEVIGLHAFRCFLRVASLSLTHLLFAMCWCIVLAHFYCKVCFKSPSVCFWGTKYDILFTVNLLLTCILFCDAGLGWEWLLVVGRGSWVVGRGSWVVGRGSWVVGQVTTSFKAHALIALNLRISVPFTLINAPSEQWPLSSADI